MFTDRGSEDVSDGDRGSTGNLAMSPVTITVTARSGNRAALVDHEDYDWASSHRWFVVWRAGSRGEGGNSAHAARHAYRADGVRTSRLMHREVYELAHGPIPAGHHIDHIDRDPFNNQRSNLRLATPLQNARNHRAKRTALAGFKGVDLDGGRWRARIQLSDGCRVSLGSFATAEQAARAYDAAARKHFGAFAMLNFPEDQEAACSVS